MGGQPSKQYGSLNKIDEKEIDNRAFWIPVVETDNYALEIGYVTTKHLCSDPARNRINIEFLASASAVLI